MKPTEDFQDLLQLVRRLRRDCPWDRKQTHDSIKDNLIEEAYEAVEAIDHRDFEELKKELGDLLLHVIFQTTMADEKDSFSIDEVIYSLQDKLIRRHPHVFEDVEVASEEEVAENWESIKMKEGKKSILDGIPKHLPALIRAQRMQEKVSNIGFDWSGKEQVWEKVEEEIGEFKAALETQDSRKISEEFGDLLFSLVNFARFMNLDAEDQLRQANQKFEERFRYVEKKLNQESRSIQSAEMDEMNQYWEEAKHK